MVRVSSDATNSDLLGRWNAGDARAGAALALEDAVWIRQRIRMARGEALARDVETEDQLQDLLVEVLAYRPRFAVKSRSQFRALLARMLQNDLIDRARRVDRRPARTQRELAETQISLVGRRKLTSPVDAAERGEELAWMRIGVEFLDDEKRRLIVGHVFDGRSFEDLANEDETNARAMRMRYTRAIVKLSGIVQRLRAGGLDQLLEEQDVNLEVVDEDE